MNSEEIYRYSLLLRFVPGFSPISGQGYTVEYEYTNPFAEPDEFGLVSTVQCLGKYNCLPETRLKRTPVSAWDILYLKAGSVVINDGAQARVMMPGSVFVASENVTYFLQTKASSCQFVILSLYGILTERFRNLLLYRESAVLSVRFVDSFEELLRNLMYYLKYPATGSRILLVNVLTQILTELYISNLDSEQYTSFGQPRWLQVALKEMENQYRKKLTISHLAEISNLSTAYFSNLFHDAMGMSPYAYLTQLRIEKAKLLLRNSDMPVKAVASTVGMPSISHFISAFRAKTGLTPERFRKSFSGGVCRQEKT